METKIEKPVFENEPSHENSIGTKFWTVDEFDHIIEGLPVDIQILFTEYVDDEGIEYWGYIIVEDDEVIFETLDRNNIYHILEAVKEESIERGYLEIEQ